MCAETHFHVLLKLFFEMISSFKGGVSLPPVGRESIFRRKSSLFFPLCGPEIEGTKPLWLLPKCLKPQSSVALQGVWSRVTGTGQQETQRGEKSKQTPKVNGMSSGFSRLPVL